MLQLFEKNMNYLRCQIGTSSRWGGRRYYPYDTHLIQRLSWCMIHSGVVLRETKDMTRKKIDEGYIEMSRDKDRERVAIEWAEELLPRRGWNIAFKSMAESGDDRLLDEDTSLTNWDRDEWEW